MVPTLGGHCVQRTPQQYINLQMARLGSFRVRVTLLLIIFFGCWVISYYFIHFHHPFQATQATTSKKENIAYFKSGERRGKWSYPNEDINRVIFKPLQELKRINEIVGNNKNDEFKEQNYLQLEETEALRNSNVFEADLESKRNFSSLGNIQSHNEINFSQNNSSSAKEELQTKELVTEVHNHSQHIVNLNQHEPICKIPELEPFHRTILHMIKNVSNLNCLVNSNPYISYVEHDQILLNTTFLKLSREPQHIHTVNCELDFIIRINDDSYALQQMDPLTTQFKMTEESWTSDLVISELHSDFYLLKCRAYYSGDGSRKDTSGANDQDNEDSYLDNETNDIENQNEHDFYQEWQAHIPERSAQFAATHLQDTSALGLDVAFIGFDSTSHMNFLRKMPKSYNYMTKSLGTVVLDGYNIVGDATTAALIPMFTGHAQRDLPDVHKDSWVETKYVDEAYPLVWKAFKKYGYVTMYGEDSPQLGWANLRLRGFKVQPTDHYMRHFWSLATDYTPYYNPINNPLFCNGPVPTHKTLTDYLAEFQTIYQKNRKFAFTFATELAHGDINRLSQADDDLYEYLKGSQEKGLLDNTLLIVFGDHGARYTDLRQTMQGKLEERLPFVSVTLPKWFSQKHPQKWKNLMRNSKMLSTPFDIHATLLSILDPNLKSKHGLSLFDELPWNRSCEDAFIDSHWCTCMSWESVPIDDENVLKAAEMMVQMINNQTKVGRDKCAELKLGGVKHAEFRVPNQKLLAFSKTVDGDQIDAAFDDDANVKVHDVMVEYELTIETLPGRGLYEGSVRVNHGKFSVDEDLSRINAYGDQPKCILGIHPHIMKYCYCKDLVQNND